MEHAQAALRAQMALEKAESLVGGLLEEFPRDPGLRRVRAELRRMVDRAEARHLDAVIGLERERVGALSDG